MSARRALHCDSSLQKLSPAQMTRLINKKMDEVTQNFKPTVPTQVSTAVTPPNKPLQRSVTIKVSKEKPNPLSPPHLVVHALRAKDNTPFLITYPPKQTVTTTPPTSHVIRPLPMQTKIVTPEHPPTVITPPTNPQHFLPRVPIGLPQTVVTPSSHKSSTYNPVSVSLIRPTSITHPCKQLVTPIPPKNISPTQPESTSTTTPVNYVLSQPRVLHKSLHPTPIATSTPTLSAETARSRKLHATVKSSVKTFSKQGKPLNSSQQTAVLNVYRYFTKEFLNNGPILSLGAIQQRTADALGVGVTSVGQIIRNSNDCGKVLTPGKTRPNIKRPILDEVDDFMKANIRRVIYIMYSKGQKVTMRELLKQCQIEEVGFKGKSSSLTKVVLTLGFKWKKTDNRRVLVESPKIVLQRINFLRSYLRNANSVNPLQPIFLDETWIFQRGTVGRTWQDDSEKSSMRGDMNDGRRFIVVHAGGRGGFVPNSSLLFASGNNTGDYHGEMNSDNFERWLENMLGNLEEPSMIVMDNASYHSAQENRQPTTSWKKDEIIKWLQDECITFPLHSLKPELLDIARRNKRETVHRCDTIIRRMGHEVLRLPPYHCHFNPIELIWATTKQIYNDNIGKNGQYTIENTKRIWEDALDAVTAVEWAKRVDHCEKIIRDTWEQEMGVDTGGVEPLIINLQDSDADESDSEYDDEPLATPLDTSF